MDDLVACFRQLLIEEQLKPLGEMSLDERQVRRIAAYVLGNFVTLGDAARAVNAARVDGVMKMSEAIMNASEVMLRTEMLDHLHGQLRDIETQGSRTKEDNT